MSKSPKIQVRLYGRNKTSTFKYSDSVSLADAARIMQYAAEKSTMNKEKSDE